MNTCIYSGKQFDRAAGEHILQNFLGARWKSHSIVCDEVQSAFGKTIDAAFERGLRPIRNLLGTSGGRGEDAPTLKGLAAASGETIDLESGGKPRLSRPIVHAKKRAGEETYEVNIKLGHKNQAGWALAELRKQIPGLKLTEEELLRQGAARRDYIQGPVKISIGLGGSDYIRGVLKACFNLIAANNILVLDSCFDDVRNFILRGSGSSSDFLRWPKRSDKSAFPRLGPIDQFVGIASRASKVEGIVSLFGGITHAIRLTSSYLGPSFKVGYLVNPLRTPALAEDRTPNFSEDVLPDFPRQPEKPGPESWAAAEESMARILQFNEKRSLSQMVEKTVAEVLLPHDGKPITKEQVDELVRKISHRFLRIEER